LLPARLSPEALTCRTLYPPSDTAALVGPYGPGRSPTPAGVGRLTPPEGRGPGSIWLASPGMGPHLEQTDVRSSDAAAPPTATTTGSRSTPTGKEPTQYSRPAVFAIWAAAAVPMGLGAWVVAPLLAGGGDMTQPLLFALTAGLAWQFLLVAGLVAYE